MPYYCIALITKFTRVSVAGVPVTSNSSISPVVTATEVQLETAALPEIALESVGLFPAPTILVPLRFTSMSTEPDWSAARYQFVIVQV